MTKCREAIALHHLDCPWRPSDIRQREGRILRQGNRNPDVQILRYVTEASFDGFVWGTVERKAQFIGQVMRGRLDVREIEDVGEVTLSFQEVKALATGNPLLLEQARADAELARLERLERAHARNQVQLRGTIRASERDIGRLGELVATTEEAIARRHDTRGDAFAMVVKNVHTTKRPEAETRLRAALTALADDRGVTDSVAVTLGGLGGFEVAASVRRRMVEQPELTLSLRDVPESDLRLPVTKLGETALVTRLENRLSGLDRLCDEMSARIDGLRGEIARAADLLGRPFPQAERLAAARSRVEAVGEELERLARTPSDDGPEPAEVEHEMAAAARREQRIEWTRNAPAATPHQPAPVQAGRPAGAMAP